MLRTVIVLLSSFALIGCASRLYIPGHRFMTSEASGGSLSGEVSVGAIGVTHVQVADDMTASSPDTTPLLLKNSSGSIGAKLGLLNGIDGYISAVGGAPTFAGAKIQLIGSPASAAKDGNFSVSIAGGAGFGNSDASVTVGDVTGKTNIKFSGWEGMVSIGYRPSSGILIYATPSMTHVAGDIKVERTSGGTTSTTAEPDGKGDMRSLALGVRLGSSFFLNLEAARTETVWKRLQPTELVSAKFEDTAWGAAIGGSW